MKSLSIGLMALCVTLVAMAPVQAAFYWEGLLPFASKRECLRDNSAQRCDEIFAIVEANAKLAASPRHQQPPRQTRPVAQK
jgi:hypothetical protein